jgi:hypothetical protein
MDERRVRSLSSQRRQRQRREVRTFAQKNYFLRNDEIPEVGSALFSESAVRYSGFFLSALALVRYQSDSGLKS